MWVRGPVCRQRCVGLCVCAGACARVRVCVRMYLNVSPILSVNHTNPFASHVSRSGKPGRYVSVKLPLRIG